MARSKVELFEQIGRDQRAGGPSTATGNKVVFELVPSPEWQWLVGEPSPVTWAKAQANPVRKVGRVISESLNARRPQHTDAGHG